MAEIGDEFKIVVVKAIRELCVKYPAKHRSMVPTLLLHSPFIYVFIYCVFFICLFRCLRPDAFSCTTAFHYLFSLLFPPLISFLQSVSFLCLLYSYPFLFISLITPMSTVSSNRVSMSAINFL